MPNVPREFGLREGDAIEFVQGVPNMREHGPLMPDGRESTLEGLPLRGYNKGADPALGTDSQIADKALAERLGWTEDRVRQWRQDNDYVWHHYSDNEQQLTPGRIHRSLPHQGGASEVY